LEVGLGLGGGGVLEGQSNMAFSLGGSPPHVPVRCWGGAGCKCGDQPQREKVLPEMVFISFFSASGRARFSTLRKSDVLALIRVWM